jgi:hypothetical protein
VYIDPADAELAALLTWHASRVTLASKLVKLKKPWERVQTLVRWEAIASARIYGRAEAEAYHADIAAALAVDAAGVTGIGEIDPVSALRDIDAALASDEQAELASARAAEASELRGEPKPTKVPRRSSTLKPAAAPKPAAVPRPRPPSSAAGVAPVPPPPPPCAVMVSLSCGQPVECFISDSWSVSGGHLSIPESVWTLDPADKLRLRYEVAGLSFHTGSPCFVVRVVRGAPKGNCYLVGTHVIKSLMSGAMRRRAGRSLAYAPVAI